MRAKRSKQRVRSLLGIWLRCMTDSAGSTSAIPSSAGTPAAASPDVKPKAEEASGSRSTSPQRRPPLSTIDSSRKVPRDAKADGVAGKLKAEVDDTAGDDFRNKCVEQLYNALAGDSTAGESIFDISYALLTCTETRILAERCRAIEMEVYKAQKFMTNNEYRASGSNLDRDMCDQS